VRRRPVAARCTAQPGLPNVRASRTFPSGSARARVPEKSVEALRTKRSGRGARSSPWHSPACSQPPPSRYCTAAPLRGERPCRRWWSDYRVGGFVVAPRRVTAWRCPAPALRRLPRPDRAPRPGLGRRPRRRPRRAPSTTTTRRGAPTTHRTSHDPSARRRRPRRPPPHPPPPPRRANSATGGATWYDTFPGGCASETLPHGVVLTVRQRRHRGDHHLYGRRP